METRYERTVARIRKDDAGGNESDTIKEFRAAQEREWWKALTPEQREIHYNRNRKCEHEYVYLGVETAQGVYDKNDQRLRESYSFDPYSHTPHMLPHNPNDAKCDCQMCANKIGIPRENVRWE